MSFLLYRTMARAISTHLVSHEQVSILKKPMRINRYLLAAARMLKACDSRCQGPLPSVETFIRDGSERRFRDSAQR
jgi:hypothetical protein